MAASKGMAMEDEEDNNLKRQIENYKTVIERDPLVQRPKHFNFNSNPKLKFLNFSKESILFFGLMT